LTMRPSPRTRRGRKSWVIEVVRGVVAEGVEDLEEGVDQEAADVDEVVEEDFKHLQGGVLDMAGRKFTLKGVSTAAGRTSI
jgi:hypothetical protein